MSLKDDRKKKKAAGGCRWCHKSPLHRTVHLLQRMDSGEGFDDIRSHLAAEFPHQAVEFHQAEIKSLEFVLRYYSRQIDENGDRLPAWRAWQLNKTSSLGIARLGLMRETPELNRTGTSEETET